MTLQEKQSLHRSYTYHANCEMWYVAAAAKQDGKMKKRSLLNAEFHHRHATYYQKKLEEFKVA